MINKGKKTSYIELLNKSNKHNLFKHEISDFISTYDGTNEYEFMALILSLDGIFRSYTLAKIGDDAYNELKDLDEEFDLLTKDLRKEYKYIYKGIMPANMPMPSRMPQQPNDEYFSSDLNTDSINSDSGNTNSDTDSTKSDTDSTKSD